MDEWINCGMSTIYYYSEIKIPLSALLFNTILEVLARATRKKKEKMISELERRK